MAAPQLAVWFLAWLCGAKRVWAHLPSGKETWGLGGLGGPAGKPDPTTRISSPEPTRYKK